MRAGKKGKMLENKIGLVLSGGLLWVVSVVGCIFLPFCKISCIVSKNTFTNYTNRSSVIGFLV